MPRPRDEVIERRIEAAIAGLRRWQRKLKLARTKVRKYKARVKGYQRRYPAE